MEEIVSKSTRCKKDVKDIVCKLRDWTDRKRVIFHDSGEITADLGNVKIKDSPWEDEISIEFKGDVKVEDKIRTTFE